MISAVGGGWAVQAMLFQRRFSVGRPFFSVACPLQTSHPSLMVTHLPPHPLYAHLLI